MPPALTVALLNTAARSAADLKIAGDPGAGAGGGAGVCAEADTEAIITTIPANPSRMTSLLDESRPMRMKRRLIGSARRAAVISLLLAAPLVAAQQRPVVRPIASGTSSISGRITDSISKAPVAGCPIQVTARADFQRASLTTGPDGSYALPDIAANSYFFVFECPGYLRSCSGRDASNNVPCGNVEVVRDQRREHVDFQLIPGAIARGRVMAFDGRPVTRRRRAAWTGNGWRGHASWSRGRPRTRKDASS